MVVMVVVLRTPVRLLLPFPTPSTPAAAPTDRDTTALLPLHPIPRPPPQHSGSGGSGATACIAATVAAGAAASSSRSTAAAPEPKEHCLLAACFGLAASSVLSDVCVPCWLLGPIAYVMMDLTARRGLHTPVQPTDPDAACICVSIE
jgi:hypothetical protein